MARGRSLHPRQDERKGVLAHGRGRELLEQPAADRFEQGDLARALWAGAHVGGDHDLARGGKRARGIVGQEGRGRVQMRSH